MLALSVVFPLLRAMARLQWLFGVLATALLGRNTLLVQELSALVQGYLLALGDEPLMAIS
jgi:hypothetical protein